MALIPNIKLCLKSNCTELVFSELTGIYNASTNVGGYGTPNPAASEFTGAILTVTAPDGTVYDIDMLEYDFPTNNTATEYIIDLADLDNRTSIEDGFWQFSYTITADLTPSSYTVTKSYYFYCNARCCVSTLLASIDISALETDAINNKKIDNYTRARTFLYSLESAANCADETKFNKIKSLVLKLCRNSNCRTCN